MIGGLILLAMKLKLIPQDYFDYDDYDKKVRFSDLETKRLYDAIN